MNQNTDKQTQAGGVAWPASDDGQYTLFHREQSAPEPISEGALANELAGINPEAMQVAMREAHRGLFGSEDELPESESAGVVEEIIAFSADAAAEQNTVTDAADTVSVAKTKLELVQKLLCNISENFQRVSELLSGGISEDEVRARIGRVLTAVPQNADDDAGSGNVIEGVFNGQCMIGPDGKQYNMPSNYASKSKLVEGDILKLTITPAGKFIYKQIGPIERTRVVGALVAGENAEYYVENDGVKWKVLTASVTYFKGRHGDEVVILVPKHGESTWAAVENIMSGNL